MKLLPGALELLQEQGEVACYLPIKALQFLAFSNGSSSSSRTTQRPLKQTHTFWPVMFRHNHWT